MNLQNALLIGFSVGCLFLTKAVCEDLQVNYTVSYDQVVSTFWYNAITQPDAQVECKVPLLEDNHLKNGALDWHGYHYVKREAQKDVILNTSRPLYINWDPDYLAFYKANQIFYEKPQVASLDAITPGESHAYAVAEGLVGMNEFQKKRALAMQANIIADFWKNARPVTPDTEIVYMQDATIGEYDFNRHAFPVNLNIDCDFNPASYYTNNAGETVSISLLHKHFNGRCDVLIFLFGGKFGKPCDRLSLQDSDAEKLYTFLQKQSHWTKIEYAMHGNLVFDKTLIEKAKCSTLVNLTTDNNYKYDPNAYCYFFDVKWIDYFKYNDKKEIFAKFATTKYEKSGMTQTFSMDEALDVKSQVGHSPQQTATRNSDSAKMPNSASASGGIGAAVNDLNTFSNYCMATLAADQDRIEAIPNNPVKTKLKATSLEIQAGINKMISHQQEYLESLTPGAEADASLKRAIPNLNIPRTSATNALTQLDIGINNAAQLK